MAENSNKPLHAGQAAPLDRLLKPLRHEWKQGCLDRAVSGGLEAFVGRWAPDLAKDFAGYAAMTPEGRRTALARALARLGEAPGAAGAVQAGLENLPAKRLPKPSAGLSKAPAPIPAHSPIPSPLPLLPTDPLTRLVSLGPKRAAALAAMGMRSVGDLLQHSPRDWQDRSRLKTISQLVEGELVTVQARILSSVNFRTRGRMSITEVAVQDPTGTLSVMYFNQPFQQRRFKAGAMVVLSGKVERRGRRWQMNNAEAEILPEGGEEALVHTGRIVPLYALNHEVSQRVFRSAVWQALPALAGLADPLPPDMVKVRGLAPLAETLRTLHFPESLDQVEPARGRMAFQELFLLSLALAQKKRREQLAQSPSLRSQDLPKRLLKALPFELTAAQHRVWQELRADLAQPRPMRRLVQGDVGSGKTVLATLCLAAAVGEGWQGALMAPTEILAEQHLRNLRAMLEPLGVEVLSLTQAQKGKGRREVLSHLASGRPLVAVGTQALIQEGVAFGRLGLVVVDEQHRFGVRQRLTLSRKAKVVPHSLVMTATPIPRTLAMTAYGDLDVSVVDGLPPGRSPVETRWAPVSDQAGVWDLVHAQIAQGRQVYVVVPLVDESDKTEWKAATKLVEELRAGVFAGLKVELLHGRLKQEEKEAVMRAFVSGAVPVLCATTVVEVGVDVANASVMVIEDADRFGLAQLHQLRGRVGRGAAQSYCFLIGEPKTEVGRRRLEVMVSTNDGFVIAEEDLRLRGPGEVLGTRQSGMPELRYVDLLKDQALLLDARQEAHALVSADPDLALPGHRGLDAAVRAGFGAKLELGSTG
jgi:ATP-dependent DNA helicase RecG